MSRLQNQPFATSLPIGCSLCSLPIHGRPSEPISDNQPPHIHCSRRVTNVTLQLLPCWHIHKPISDSHWLTLQRWLTQPIKATKNLYRRGWSDSKQIILVVWLSQYHNPQSASIWWVFQLFGLVVCGPGWSQIWPQDKISKWRWDASWLAGSHRTNSHLTSANHTSTIPPLPYFPCTWSQCGRHAD